MFTIELGVPPAALALWTVGQIVDHLEYITTKGGSGGRETGADS